MSDSRPDEALAVARSGRSRRDAFDRWLGHLNSSRLLTGLAVGLPLSVVISIMTTGFGTFTGIVAAVSLVVTVADALLDRPSILWPLIGLVPVVALAMAPDWGQFPLTSAMAIALPSALWWATLIGFPWLVRQTRQVH